MESGNVIRAIKAAVDNGFSIAFSPDDKKGHSVEMLILDRKAAKWRTFHVHDELLGDKSFDVDLFYVRKIERYTTGMMQQRG